MFIKNEKINDEKSINIINKVFKKSLLILNIFAILLVFTYFLYNSSSRISLFTDKKISQVKDFFIPKEYEFSAEALWDITKYSLMSNTSDIKIDDFVINADFKNINRFYNQLDQPSETNNTKKYSKGTFIFDTSSYKIKFRPKGDRAIHYVKDKPSFSIKVLKGEALKGMNHFSLQNPSIRNFLSEYLWLELLKNNNIITPDYHFVNLLVNGNDLGIYSYEEKPTTFMLERLGKKNSSILKFNETYGTDITTNPEISVINSEDVPLKNQKIATSILRKFINGKSTVSETFDIEKLATFFAISDLCKTYHALYAKSARFYYNTYTNLLEPIPFDGHAGSEGPLLTSELVDNNNPIGQSEFPNWIKLFFNNKNNDFVDLYYNKLNYFSSTKNINNILSDVILEEKLELSKKIIYRLFPLEQTNLMPYYFDYRKYLMQSSEFIRAKLSKDYNIQFFADINDSSIHIKSYNLSSDKMPIKIVNIHSKNISYKINKTINFKQNFELDFSSKDSIFNDILTNKKLEVEYLTMGGKKILKEINLFPYKEESGNYSSNYLQKLINLKQVIRKENNLFFKHKITNLNEILIIPKSLKLKIIAGQQINFENEGAIISYGDLHFDGDEKSSILIKSRYNSATAGYILAIGSSEIIINGVEFNNLANPEEKDIPGSVTFYNSKVSILNTIFNNNSSEDFLNLVECEFILNDIIFKKCESDCFDSDFSNGKLLNTSFSLSKNDGLDVSGSNIQVNNLVFSSIGDKAISAGENSTLNLDNISIKNSEIGITCKDGSFINSSHIDLINVRVPIALFKKKNRYKDPKLVLNNYSSEGFITPHLVQKPFVMELNSDIITGQLNDVETLLYGNDFGIKTIR